MATNSSSGSHLFWTIQEFAPEENIWATSLSQLSVVGDNEVLINPDDTASPGGTGGYGSAMAQAYDGGFSLEKILMEGNFGALNLPDDLMASGDMAFESYMLDFSAVLRNGNRTVLFDDLKALVEQKFTLTQLEDGFKLFDTQLLTFDLFGLPDDLLLTLDDARPSLGRLALVDTPFGTMVESYIDLFTVLSIDGQLLPSQNASRLLLRPPVVPEPATATLGILGVSGLVLRRRRTA